MSMSIYEELFRLIQMQDLENVKHILSSRTDINVKTHYRGQGTTLLHYATTAEICKELISHGASVNARDAGGQTALHHAILYRRGLEIVRELLRCGACVNACDNYKCTPLMVALQLWGRDLLEIVRELLQYGADPNVHDYQGNSVLTLAIYEKDLELIKELLQWGADINIQNRSPIHCFLLFPTPLSAAINGDEDCAKTLIKMTVLKDFDNNYKQILDLSRFSDISSFTKLNSYLEECACEIVQMKSHRINSKYSLFDFVRKSGRNFKPLYWNDDTVGDISSAYPIYYDVIFTNIQPHLFRARLLNKLKCLRLHVSIDISTVDYRRGKEIFLDADCLFKIAEFLTNDELSRLLKAFDDY